MPVSKISRAVEMIGLGLVLSIAGCQAARPAAPAAPRLERTAPGIGSYGAPGSVGATASAPAGDASTARGGRAEELLAGRFAGVDVVCLPSGDYSIRIRGVRSLMGDNEALIVIDGIPTPPGVANPLRDVAPADVVRIDVLKDAASAAIYGGRGANGVILIQTKRGLR